MYYTYTPRVLLDSSPFCFCTFSCSLSLSSNYMRVGHPCPIHLHKGFPICACTYIITINIYLYDVCVCVYAIHTPDGGIRQITVTYVIYYNICALTRRSNTISRLAIVEPSCPPLYRRRGSNNIPCPIWSDTRNGRIISRSLGSTKYIWNMDRIRSKDINRI